MRGREGRRKGRIEREKEEGRKRRQKMNDRR